MLRADLVASAGRFELDASIGAEAGVPLGLLGGNGAGKTTLLRCIAGLHRPERGRVSVGGEVWFDRGRGIDLAAHRRSVGLVPQHGMLFPHLDVTGNIAYGPRASGLSRTAVRRVVAAALERFSLIPLAARRTGSLSGGERQRVALARACALDPPLLLLDEPLAALDPLSRIEARATLREVVRERGDRCTVLVTHDVRDAVDIAGRLVVLDGGRVLQEGTATGMLQHPRSPLVAALIGQNWLSGDPEPGAGDLWTVAAGELRLMGVADPGEPPQAGRPAYLLIDPRDITLHATLPEGSAQNTVRARVALLSEAGGHVRVTLGTTPPLTAEITPGSATQLGVHPGRILWASFKATASRVFG